MNNIISNFPVLLPDETLYSAIARYHSYSGNACYRDTIDELFSNTNISPTVEFPSGLKALEKILSGALELTADYVIQNHTLFPLYAPFLSKSRKRQLLNKMKYSDGKGIKAQIGFLAGGICRKDGLMYCPLCVSEDIQKFGEAYFHRVHQAEGVFVCPDHKCFLREYPLKTNDVSRLMFIKPEFIEPSNLDSDYIKEPELSILIELAKAVQYLLNTPLNDYDKKAIQNKYLTLLSKKSFVTTQGYIRQREVYEAFKAVYKERLLEILDSSIDFDNDYNWLKVALRDKKRVTHPIRSVLIMLFLSQSVEEFFKDEQLKTNINHLYPCLNPVCKNYKKMVANKQSTYWDKKLSDNISTFSCHCGFVYTRKESDNIYLTRRIKSFGTVWESKLRDLLIEQVHSLRQISRILGCDPKTTVRYADKLGMKNYLNTSMDMAYTEKGKPAIKVDSDSYKDVVLNLICENPMITRQEIRLQMNKQYIWLYKNDKKWFDVNMPKNRKPNGNNNNMNVDWKERDEKMLELLKNEYEALMQIDRYSRVNKSMIGRKINLLSLLEKKLDRLPKSKKYLDEILETIEDYQMRRIDYACEDIINADETLSKWKIERKAGLRKGYSSNVEDQIELNLMKYTAETNRDGK
ncbi:MAG: hypothetical protein K0S61_566 [Anaerocolumna sp.]|nr:hypothetical protein [Anaerocolumna sp.]